MKVLFLSAWYPTERDPMAGLFVQKHAEAVRRLGADVRVIYNEEKGLKWWLRMRRDLHALWYEGWRPDVTQVNVNGKNALIALYLKIRYGIPYLIVEHWSGYLKENGQFSKLSKTKRLLYRIGARGAEIILTVSDHLAEAMRECDIQAKRWGRIHNVVDDVFYEEDEKRNTKDKWRKTLLHVSCFDEQAKNIKGLLRAAKALAAKRQDWRLVLVGEGIDYDKARTYAKELMPMNNQCRAELCFTGELTPRQVADEMHRADALVLSSRYETYGVVLAEAVAAGLPILSTPVGIAQEVADIIIPQEIAQHDAERFAELIASVLWRDASTSNKKQNTRRFSQEVIGKQLMELYAGCVHRDI